MSGMDYTGNMCRPSSQGGRRCSDKNPTCKSRSSLLSKKRYLESGGKDSSHIDQEIAMLEQAQSKFGDIVIHHTMMMDDDTVNLLGDLKDEGFTPLVVGGAVRDSLQSGIEPKDIDIEVHDVRSMSDLVRGLRRAGYPVNEVGRSFGVIKTTLPNGMEIDLSLPRRDNLVGNGHRGFQVEVDPDMNIYEAAGRRDFTLNALYYDHSTHSVIDPYHGTEDLKNGVLRHVSDAYAEDPLRVLRGVQIASRFNLTMADETVAESRRIKDQYDNLSNERVQEEWHKFMTKGKNHIRNGLEVLHDTGWDEKLGLQDLNREDTAQKVESVIKLAEQRDQDAGVFATACFARELSPEARSAFIKTVLVGQKRQAKAISLSSMETPDNLKSRKEVVKWARQLVKQDLSIKEWSTLYSKTGDADYVKRVSDIARKNDSYEKAVPDYITGAMILETANTQQGGRWVGKAMAEARRAQDEVAFTDAESAQAWLTNHIDSLKNMD